jgi:hypothetical protein
MRCHVKSAIDDMQDVVLDAASDPVIFSACLSNPHHLPNRSSLNWIDASQRHAIMATYDNH